MCAYFIALCAQLHLNDRSMYPCLFDWPSLDPGSLRSRVSCLRSYQLLLPRTLGYIKWINTYHLTHAASLMPHVIGI